MAELLQEFVDSRGVTVSVDREFGILRGVKLIGLQSRNGRSYRESALSDASVLYEEAKVNVNHPKDGPLAPRDYQDRLGVIRDVKLRSGEGLFGDLHFNPKHTLAEQLLWDAEHNPHNVGFSHNVLARLSRDGEKSIVEEITKVQSVDLVADPATTQGLFEQADGNEITRESTDPCWDVLTLEVLQLHRPDLLAEIHTHDASQLQQQLAETQSMLERSQRRQRVYELLCEHHLSIANDQSSAQKVDRRTVSPSFVDLLIEVNDESKLKALITERAELTYAAAANTTVSFSPCSRDQTSLVGYRPMAPTNSRDFASILKSSLN